MEDIWTLQRCGLVAKLLEECEAGSSHYVASNIFRKRNFEKVQDVDLLVHRGFILDKNARYSVSVLCLPQIDSGIASKILDDANLLWKAYGAEFLNSDNDSAFLSTVAKAAGLGMGDAQRALHYMMQTNWHRGHATPADGLYDSVVIGEEVLRYESFSLYLAQLYKQQSDLNALTGPFGESSFMKLDESTPKTLPVLNTAKLPVWVVELPEGLKELLKETFQAKEQGWNRLAAMGIRAMFDMVSTEALQVDAGGFKKKLEEMVREEHIALTQHENLNALVETGHAAAHRGFNPTPEMVDAMWGIAMNALESFFVLKPKAQKLMGDTPARTSRN
jgi:hypothetical protein